MARRDVSSPTARDQVSRPVVIRRGDPGFGSTGPRPGRLLKWFGAAFLLIGAYVGIGQFRHDIVAAYPESYPVLRALGFGDVAEPVGYGLSLETGTALIRIEGDGSRWVVVSVRIVNTTDRALTVPRLALVVTPGEGRQAAWTHDFAGLSLPPGRTHTAQLRYLVGNVSGGPPFRGIRNTQAQFVRN